MLHTWHSHAMLLYSDYHNLCKLRVKQHKNRDLDSTFCQDL